MRSATSAVLGKYCEIWKSPFVLIDSTGPCTSLLRGFGSKVSRWLMPPDMFRKMTCSASFPGPLAFLVWPIAPVASVPPSMGATVTPR